MVVLPLAPVVGTVGKMLVFPFIVIFSDMVFPSVYIGPHSSVIVLVVFACSMACAGRYNSINQSPALIVDANELPLHITSTNPSESVVPFPIL